MGEACPNEGWRWACAARPVRPPASPGKLGWVWRAPHGKCFAGTGERSTTTALTDLHAVPSAQAGRAVPNPCLSLATTRLERSADPCVAGCRGAWRARASARLLASRLLHRALLVHPAVQLRPGDFARVQPLQELRLALAVEELERLLVRANVEDAVARVDPKARVGAGVSLDDHCSSSSAPAKKPALPRGAAAGRQQNSGGGKGGHAVKKAIALPPTRYKLVACSSSPRT